METTWQSRTQNASARGFRVRARMIAVQFPFAQREVVGIHLGDHERYVRLEAQVAGVREHSVTACRQSPLDETCFASGEGAETKVRFEVVVDVSEDEVGGGRRERPVHPPDRVSVRLPGMAGTGDHLGEAEPGMGFE